jgi:FkbM family methyltransferase
LRARLDKTCEQLDKTREQRDKLRQQLDEAEQRSDRMREKLRALDRVASTRKEQRQQYRRRVPSSGVLKDLLLARRAQVPYRAAARDAAAREARLMERSASYRHAAAGAGPDPGPLARHIELDGLSWWVPVGSDELSAVERVVHKEALPYRALTQGREVCTGGVMLDLGAHDGGTAIPRVVLGEVEACYCAEPDPLNYSCLVANVIQNGLRGFVLPDRVAIGGADRDGRLLRMKASRGHRMLADGTAVDGDTVDVRVRTLDRWIDDLGIDPRAISFVKSDTQGYELQILGGAARLLAQPQIAWQLEVCPRLMLLAGDDPREFVAFLQRHFTHFIDLYVGAPGNRRRQIAELPEAIEYLDRGHPHTDVIVYRTSAGGL